MPSRLTRATAAPTPDAAVATGEGAETTYVYCVVRSARRPSMPHGGERLPGGGAPQAIDVGRGRWLVVAAVPVGQFRQEALDERLKDLDWVSRCGLAHQAVVEHFLRTPSAAVVPMALFTIFDSEARALAEVRRDTARLDATLDRVAGRREWVVRVLRGDPTVTRAERTASPMTARGDGRSGRAFLQAKADQRIAAKRAAQEADAAVRALAHALTEIADDVSTRTDVPGLGSTAVLDAAFLVPRSAEARFEREARRRAQPLADRGFRVSVTGPWPCYSFVGGRRPS